MSNRADPTNDGQQPDFVITLVHGTWASDTPWTRENSELRKEIRETLKNQGYSVRFEKFEWSGANVYAARFDAGKRLKEKLAKLFDDYDRSRHFLVSHSHGGNVCLYALRDIDQRDEKIRGLVCMATPFLICKERKLTERLGRIRDSILYGKNFFVALLVGGAVLLEPLIQSESLVLKAIGIAMLLFLIALWLLPYGKAGDDKWRSRFLKKIHIFTDRVMVRTMCDLQMPAPPNPPILCLNPLADEARGLLKIVERVAYAPFTFGKVYQAVWFCLGVLYGLWRASSPLLEDLRRVSPELRLESLFDSVWSASFAGAIWGTLFSVGGFVFAELVRWAMPTVLKGRAYGFGRAPSYYNWFAKISVREKPPDGFESPDVEPFRLDRPLLGLRHSQIYKSEKAQKRIAEWIFTQGTSDNPHP